MTEYPSPKRTIPLLEEFMTKAGEGNEEYLKKVKAEAERNTPPKKPEGEAQGGDLKEQLMRS